MRIREVKINHRHKLMEFEFADFDWLDWIDFKDIIRTLNRTKIESHPKIVLVYDKTLPASDLYYAVQDAVDKVNEPDIWQIYPQPPSSLTPPMFENDLGNTPFEC